MPLEEVPELRKSDSPTAPAKRTISPPIGSVSYSTLAGRSSLASNVSTQSDRRKLQLAKMEDLEIALDTALQVNRHLNLEVERCVREIEQVEKERDAWKAHAIDLAKKLAATRQQSSGRTAEQEAAELSKLPEINASFIPSPDFIWSTQHPLLSEVLERGKQSGWLIHHSEVQLHSVLGEGAFGKTYKGTWRGGVVAIKCVRVGDEKELINFLREVEALASLRHPNVLPFLAACLDSQDHCWLVSEYLSGGNLHSWLYGGNAALPPNRSVVERLQIALEVARGMRALEAAGSAPILHRDLKPSNVLMDAGGHARLGDFGLARRLLPGCAATLTGETGSYLYMSPEMIRHDMYDMKTDVWSWGVLLVELVLQRAPYQDTYMTPVQIALAVADETLQPPVPEDLDLDLQALVVACCDFDPENRPSFDTIVSEMTRVLPQVKAQHEASGNGSGVLGRFLRKGTLPSSWSNAFSRVSNALT